MFWKPTKEELKKDDFSKIAAEAEEKRAKKDEE